MNKKGRFGFSAFLASLLALSINASEVNAESIQPENPKPASSIEQIIKREYNYKRISDNAYSLKAAPVKAGKSTEISVVDWNSDKKDAVEKIILYEDAAKIAEGQGVVKKEIVKENAGKHIYNAELHFKSGDIVKTKSIEVEFEGKEVDFLPVETWFHATREAGKAAKICVEGEDIGDRKGIEKIILYENGRKIAEEKGDRFYLTLERPAGRFRYHAEIVDKTGNVTKTKEQKISFLGKAFAPDIYWFYTSPKNVGRSVKILADATDKKNLDANSGIAKIVLYENDKKIKEINDDSIYEIITKDQPEKCIYRVEAVNKNGETARSEKIAVNFSGKDLPPEISWFTARAKDSRATICVDAKDDANVRKDAGIKEILLYEDGKLIHKAQDNSLYKEIFRHDASKHVYHAEVINNSGIKAISEKIELKYF